MSSKPDSARSQVDNRPGEIRIATQIGRHAAGMRQSKDRRYLGCANQVIGVNLLPHHVSLE